MTDPTPPPRTWALPADPGPDVRAVRDAHGRVWRRCILDDWCLVDADRAHTHTHWAWSRLVAWCGPLTDATPPDLTNPATQEKP